MALTALPPARTSRCPISVDLKLFRPNPGWFATAWTYALLGEHLGQPWLLGAAGLAIISLLYLLNQGDGLATAIPGFPVWGPAGAIGSTGWGLWVAALGDAALHPASACWLALQQLLGVIPQGT
jgi:hypothetical protein